MKKSLVKYILQNVKQTPLFEERLSEVFSHSLNPETSLEALCYGVPVRAKITDNALLIKSCTNRYSDPTGVKITSITKVNITDEFKLRVFFKYSQQRWFSSEDAANQAIAREARYEGSSSKDAAHPVEGWVPNLSDDWTFDPDDLNDCIEVIRK